MTDKGLLRRIQHLQQRHDKTYNQLIQSQCLLQPDDTPWYTHQTRRNTSVRQSNMGEEEETLDMQNQLQYLTAPLGKK